ncbi:MAG: threonine--tRNA ligase [Candidatus Gracilibacteria bacterium]|nr:threonine--tRNA ligase [Candidatus Gracilibacteria bacterium]MDD2909048.1 threonine--tRNA ligase [Candidatus Gracilibacteria bacterium]
MSHEISTIRHSLSHILAQAVKSIYPEVQLAIGPSIENGFYYDFDFGDIKLEEGALKEIEKKMKNIIKQNQLFEEYVLPIDDSIEIIKNSGEIYKLEMAEDLKKSGETELTFYRNKTQQGVPTFVDMCRGPHVDKTLDIDENAFKLERISGAYWKGDANNKMLTRIYGFAFESREKLDEYLKNLEEAKKRDHKIIGKNLDLFSFHHESPGSAFWHPAGLIIWRELENFWREFHIANGYTEIQTPQMAKNDLWITSGHWDHYKEDMYHWEESDETFCLKPMSCPFGVLIYNEKQSSYKDLPIRFNEIGRIFRNEKSGELNGLFRVRTITQDDAHIYLREDQIFNEIKDLLNMVKEFYAIFKFKPNFFLSTRPDSFLGEIETWNKAEDDLRSALSENNIEYGLKEGDGAFYGPKIDIQIKDAIGRTWQLATIQLDFQLPGRFGMEYVDKDGTKKTPVMIHRAIFGSFERLIGILTEHFSGIYPLWLAPRQVVVVPVSDAFNDYGRKVYDELKQSGIRVSIDDSSDSLNKKVRNAEKMHINYILVVGEKEKESNTVSVRNYKTKDQNEEGVKAFLSDIKAEINNKKI